MSNHGSYEGTNRFFCDLADEMDIYDNLPPEVRKVIQDAPYPCKALACRKFIEAHGAGELIRGLKQHHSDLRVRWYRGLGATELANYYSDKPF
tara:strand:- start:2640 stop:2918 length:279 start_codon:yes stop_codon:yes gene_type:complete